MAAGHAADMDGGDASDADDEALYENHVLSVCAALGGLLDEADGSGSVYVPGDECLACLRDLKRFLRSAERDKDRHIHDLLRKWRVLETDLLPLLSTSVRNNDIKTAIAVCELLVPLTWPYDSENKPAYHAELKEYQQAFLQDGVLPSIMAVLVHLFATPHKQRSEKDHARLRLIVSLFRNIIAVGDRQVSVTTASAESQWRSSLQERLIVRMHTDGVIELLLSLGGSLMDPQFEGWNVLLIEIFNLMFDRRDVSRLVAPLQRSEHLAELLKREQIQRSFTSRSRSTRHPRFGGNFAVTLPGGTTMNTRNASTTDLLPTKIDRPGLSKPRRRKIDLPANVPIGDPETKTTLLDIANQLITECFNDIVISMKRDFDRQRAFVKPEHYMQYIRFCNFVLDFRQQSNRADNPIHIKTILSVMNVPNLVFVQRRIGESCEEKTPIETTLCLRLLDQMMIAVEELTQSDDIDLADIGTQLAASLFYEHDQTVLLRSLCKATKQHTKGYLEALVGCIDTLLEFGGRVSMQQGTVITRKRARNARPKPTGLDAAGIDTADHDADDTMSVTETLDHDEPQYVEKSFDFNRYMEGFVHENTIATYCQLLGYYPEITTESITQILRMFTRISRDYGRVDLFHRLSTLNMMYSVQSQSKQLSQRESWHRELTGFLSTVVGDLTRRVQSTSVSSDDRCVGPVVLVKMLFGDLDPDAELSRMEDDEGESDVEDAVYRDDIGDTLFCRTAYMMWTTTTLATEHRDAFFSELCDVLVNVQRGRSDMTILTTATTSTIVLSEMMIRLVGTSDEVQQLLDVSGLQVDGHGAVVVPMEWTDRDLADAVKTILYLRSRREKGRGSVRRGSKKRRKMVKEVANTSAQFLEDSGDEGRNDEVDDDESRQRRSHQDRLGEGDESVLGQENFGGDDGVAVDEANLDAMMNVPKVARKLKRATVKKAKVVKAVSETTANATETSVMDSTAAEMTETTETATETATTETAIATETTAKASSASKRRRRKANVLDSDSDGEASIGDTDADKGHDSPNRPTLFGRRQLAGIDSDDD